MYLNLYVSVFLLLLCLDTTSPPCLSQLIFLLNLKNPKKNKLLLLKSAFFYYIYVFLYEYKIINNFSFNKGFISFFVNIFIKDLLGM